MKLATATLAAVLATAAARDSGVRTRRRLAESCYDMTVHQCSCTDANCDAGKCAATGGVWTDGCSGEPCTCATGLQFPPVAGYEPSSDVGDQCAIDLEQAAMEDKLNDKTEEAVVEARAVYNDGADGNGGRTLAGLSTSAGTEMAGDRHFKYFADYYGHDDYAHRWVEAAFTGSAAGFERGDADFSQYSILGRLQGIKKGTAYMTVLMSALHEVTSAAEECADGNAAARRAWDAAWCYYVGSLEGKLAYTLANKRCQNFKTCGDDGDEIEGTAKVNADLLGLFSAGNTQLRDGDCVGARATADLVANHMYVGVIQGTLRYAYKVSAMEGGATNEVWKAEGAVFAAAVLPRIFAASPDAAATIYDQVRVGAPTTDYIAVKAALESTYPALGLSCADVGGYWDSDTGAYFDGMEPCNDAPAGKGGKGGKGGKQGKGTKTRREVKRGNPFV